MKTSQLPLYLHKAAYTPDIQMYTSFPHTTKRDGQGQSQALGLEND